MWRFLNTRGVDLGLLVVATTALAIGPAWAVQPVPGPAAGAVVGGAILGAIIIAKVWRRK